MSSHDTKKRQDVKASSHKRSYIPPEYLPNLKKYKYSGADYSIMSRYVMKHYWDFVVSLVPMTVAPNMITFVGFLIGMSSWVVLMYYFLFENAEYPAWTWYYSAFTLFTYQTFDAIDGKQARRTGMGSPLGELFDHGCDAFLTPFVQMNLALATGLSPNVFFFFLLESSLGLFTAIWEQFSTGTLDLGYVSGPTDGILLSCGLLAVTGVKGQAYWDTPVVRPYKVAIPQALTAPFAAHPVAIHVESLRSVLLLMFTVSWVFTVGANVFHVLVRPTVHKNKAVPSMSAAPMGILTVMHVLLFLFYRDVHEAFPFTFELSFGILVSICVTRMTICRLCIMPYNPFSAAYIFTFVVTAVGLVLHAYEPIPSLPRPIIVKGLGYAMVALVVTCVWQYVHMVVSVFRQIAEYLNIRIMSITPKKQE